MRKILLFSYQLTGFGGTESVLKKWFENLTPEQGYKLDLLIYGNPPDKSFLNGNKLYVIPQERGIKMYKILVALRKLLKKNEYDDIICLGFNHLKATHVVLPTLFLKKKPRVFYWTHFRVEDNQYTEFNRFLLKKTDGVLSLCEDMSKQFIELGVDENKIFTIYNPIVREKLKSRSENGKQFYYIGRLDENQKRVSDLIKAFYLLSKEGDDSHLTIIGVGDSYEFYEYLIKKFRLKNKVFLCDIWFKNPWDYIKEIDCLILPSNFEGFGLVIAESIARGIPVISSDCKVGPANIIKDGVSGYLYEVGDILSLKEKIEFIRDKKLETSPEIIQESIDKMYIDNYFIRVKEILDKN